MQGRFLPRCHNNRPDSYEDTPRNSSPRSFPVFGSLLNGNDMYLKKKITFNVLCFILQTSKRKKCKPDLFLNVFKYHETPLNIFKCLIYNNPKQTTQLFGNLNFSLCMLKMWKLTFVNVLVCLPLYEPLFHSVVFKNVNSISKCRITFLY